MNVFYGLYSAMLVGATPILLAAIGGAFTYYAGIFNIAMEGMMLVGAFCAVLGSFFLHSWMLGIVSAIAGALVMAGIFVLFAVRLHTDEFLTGIALNLFAVGLTTFLLRDIFHVKGAFTDPGIVAIPSITVPLLGQIPVLGRLVSGYNAIIYVALLVTIASAFVVFRTSFGASPACSGLQCCMPQLKRRSDGCDSGLVIDALRSLLRARGRVSVPGVGPALRGEHVRGPRLDLALVRILLLRALRALECGRACARVACG